MKGTVTIDLRNYEILKELIIKSQKIIENLSNKINENDLNMINMTNKLVMECDF